MLYNNELPVSVARKIIMPLVHMIDRIFGSCNFDSVHIAPISRYHTLFYHSDSDTIIPQPVPWKSPSRR